MLPKKQVVIKKCRWTPKELHDEFFTQHCSQIDPKKSRQFLCKCCILPKVFLQITFNGYFATSQHALTHHASVLVEKMEAADRRKAHSPGDSLLRGGFTAESTDKAKNIYGWIDWTLTDNLCFDFCERPTTQKYSKLKAISTHTLL